MSGRFVNFKLAKMLRIKLALTLMNQSVICAGIPWHCGNDIWNHQRGVKGGEKLCQQGGGKLYH